MRWIISCPSRMLHSSHPWLLSPSCSWQFWHLVISLLLLHLNPYPSPFLSSFIFIAITSISNPLPLAVNVPRRKTALKFHILLQIIAITSLSSQIVRIDTQVYSVYSVLKYTKKNLAVSMSFLVQITMNDNIIMSKQLFMIPERKACRLHNVQLFTD